MYNFRKTLISFDGAQITNLAVLGPYLYWIDREKQAIERANKSTGDIMEGNTVMNQTPNLMDIISIYIPTSLVIKYYTCSLFVYFSYIIVTLWKVTQLNTFFF